MKGDEKERIKQEIGRRRAKKKKIKDKWRRIEEMRR